MIGSSGEGIERSTERASCTSIGRAYSIEGEKERTLVTEPEERFFGELSESDEDRSSGRLSPALELEAIDTRSVDDQDSEDEKGGLVEEPSAPDPSVVPIPVTPEPVARKTLDVAFTSQSAPVEKFMTVSPVRRVGRFTELSIQWRDEVDKDGWSAVPSESSSLRTREIYLSRSRFKDANMRKPVSLGQ